MFNWKSRKEGKPSASEPGNKKGESCRADWMKKHFMTAARAYKNDPNTYHTYCVMSLKLNKLDGAKRK